MSAAKGIRLWLRPARDGHAAVYIIRDGSRQKSTGCGPREIERATELLGAYIAAHYKPDTNRSRELSRIYVADVISVYQTDVADKKARPKANRARLGRLLDFFGMMTLAEINKTKCREYAVKRGSDQAARRELEDLRAAINHFYEDEAVPPPVNIFLPPKATPRDVWMNEGEAARLLWTAWRRSQSMPHGGKRFVSRHIARFILVGLYTGTRSSAICGAAIRPTEGRGYVDLERGVFYRRPPGTAETNKRQPPVRLPDKLLTHLRRWERLGLCEHSVVEWERQPVKRVSKGFRQVAESARLPKVTPHVLRHTSITWAMQRGTKAYDASYYFGVSEKVIRTTYGHHDPEHQREVTSRMDRRPVAPPVAVQRRQNEKAPENNRLGG